MDKLSKFRPLFFLIGILVFAALAIDLLTRMSTLNYLKDQKRTLEADISNLQATLDEVNEEIDYTESDTAVDEWARQQGLMMKEGDHIIIPLKGTYVPPTQTPTPVITPTEAPDYAIWQHLIFGE